MWRKSRDFCHVNPKTLITRAVTNLIEHRKLAIRNMRSYVAVGHAWHNFGKVGEFVEMRRKEARRLKLIVFYASFFSEKCGVRIECCGVCYTHNSHITRTRVQREGERERERENEKEKEKGKV
jgi:hypothetical protein